MTSSRRNVLTLMSGTMLAQALPIVISPILSRLFSPEDFGVLALYIAVTGIFGAIANGRYELAIMLPQEDDEAKIIVALGVLIAMATSLALMGVVFIAGESVAEWLGQPGNTWWLYFAPCSVLLVGLFNMLNYYNNRQKSYRKMAVSQVTKAGVTVASQLGSGSFKAAGPGLVLGRIAGELAAVFVLLRQTGAMSFYVKVSRVKLYHVAKRYKDFPKFSMWSILFNQTGSRSVEFFISAVYSMGMLGQYALMQRVLGAPSALVGSAIGQVFFQEASEERKLTGKAIQSFDRTFLLLSTLSICGFGLLYFVAEPLFAFVFGEQWRVAGELTKILIPLLIFRFVAVAMSLINSVFEKQKMALYWQTGIFILYFSILAFTYWSDGDIYFLINTMSIVMSIHYASWLFSMYLISRGRI